MVLLLVRGAHPAPLSHGSESQCPATPADMAAAGGHAGIAAFLSEQALLLLMKENKLSLDDASGPRTLTFFSSFALGSCILYM